MFLSLLHVSVFQGSYTPRSNFTHTRPQFREEVPFLRSRESVGFHLLRVSEFSLSAELHLLGMRRYSLSVSVSF